MELTALLSQYHVPLTKTEHALFTGLDTTGSTRSDAYYEQQAKRLADGCQVLQQMPDKKTLDRQNKAEKIKMLKERLKMLKQMIPFMSADAAKSLKAEMKQIAAQVASLGDSGAGSGNLFTGGFGAPQPSTVTDTSADSAPRADAAVAEARAETAADNSTTEQRDTTNGETDEAKDKQATGLEHRYLEQANQCRNESAVHRAEQEDLEKLRQLYKEVKNMLERKLQKPRDPGTQAALQLQAYQAAAETLQSVAVSLKG